jgi:hypothetical protein
MTLPIDRIDFDKANELLHSLPPSPSTGHACATLCFVIMNIVNQIPKEGRCFATKDLMQFIMELHTRGWKMEGDCIVWGEGPIHTHQEEDY